MLTRVYIRGTLMVSRDGTERNRTWQQHHDTSYLTLKAFTSHLPKTRHCLPLALGYSAQVQRSETAATSSALFGPKALTVSDSNRTTPFALLATSAKTRLGPTSLTTPPAPVRRGIPTRENNNMSTTYALPSTIEQLLAVIAAAPINKAAQGEGWSTEFDITDDGQGGYDESPILELRVPVTEAIWAKYDWAEMRDLTSGTAWEYDTCDETEDTWELVFTRDTSPNIDRAEFNAPDRD